MKMLVDCWTGSRRSAPRDTALTAHYADESPEPHIGPQDLECLSLRQVRL